MQLNAPEHDRRPRMVFQATTPMLWRRSLQQVVNRLSRGEFQQRPHQVAGKIFLRRSWRREWRAEVFPSALDWQVQAQHLRTLRARGLD